MTEQSECYHEINQIIAADYRFGEVTPDDDQIWELSTSRGEPPGVALSTTYGLRAYGMRLYPRFTIKGISYSDPHSFSRRPAVLFSAPNFVVLDYAPFSSLDVLQRIWVPDSQVLVGHVTLTNTTNSLLQFMMEWVAQLNPLLAGSPMTATQISVNTVLQGQSGRIHPVFFLTGGPRSDYSAFPSLGVEVSLTPNSSRQFTWALSALDSVDESFYSARKSTAWSLENEQVKIAMKKRFESVEIDTGDPSVNQLIDQSQQRLFQLLLPPFQQFKHPSYVSERDPDQGAYASEKTMKYEQDWGIQRISEIWSLSRMLLPARPDLVKELLQNLFDQQAPDGTIFAQTGWNGNVTNLPAAPLLISLVLDTYKSNPDKEWLTLIHPALTRYLQAWFHIRNDDDEDGWPEWKHLLQTGLAESAAFSRQMKIELQVLAESAEWPSLAALLMHECQGLKKIAALLNTGDEQTWLNEKIEQLEQSVQGTWDEKNGFFNYRDRQNHNSPAGKRLHLFKQNGKSAVSFASVQPARIYILFTPRDGELRHVECKIKGVTDHHEKTVTLSGRQFQWQGDYSYVVPEELFKSVKEIEVSGMIKGDQVEIRLVDFQFKGPDFIIPLWTGLTSREQAQRIVRQAPDFLEKNRHEIPLYIKIMWIEGLLKYGYKESAWHYYCDWFLNGSIGETEAGNLANNGRNSNPSTASLHDLIPIQTLLNLLGIERITDNELCLQGFNEFLPKVIVQYKKFTMELETSQTSVKNTNGESMLITDPGPHRIKLS